MIEIRLPDETVRFSEELPLLPLRDVVVFPRMILPLLVGRARSVSALTSAIEADRFLVVAAQKAPETADPLLADLHRVGVVIRVLQLIRLPDGTIKVLVEGIARVAVVSLRDAKEHLVVRVAPFGRPSRATSRLTALVRSVRAQFEEYVELHKKVPDEVLISVANVSDPEALADVIGAHLLVPVDAKQRFLAGETTWARFAALSQTLNAELEILRIEKRIEGEVRSQVEKNQKEFYLTEQLKAIRKELGDSAEGSGEADELLRAVERSAMPDEVRQKAVKEIERLRKMAPLSPEATVVRNYVDWLVALPWGIETEDTKGIATVERILDEDHYGLEKVKERIVEYVSVMQLVKKIRGPILCFVGAPGVGKTSLGRSIARALGRKFVRISLGGIRDEAEIRGHRRTYIGSLPGRIVQSMRKAGSVNPVFLLDEVDKMSKDFHGDPASALLEVLDPEQNSTFSDHYLEVEFDLSRVMFLTTANSVHGIPPALLDRMEMIRLPGYLEPEKVKIARGFLIPKQMKEHGLTARNVSFHDGAILAIIRGYTREAGVRNLEREIARICRKTARDVASRKKRKRVTVTARSIPGFLGVRRYQTRRMERRNWVGVANGLAWTETGGDNLWVEVATVPGKGELTLTGHLGTVMQESARAALTVVRSRAAALGLGSDFYKTLDVHVHVPEGAMPKDGPSAGITIAAALISSLTGVPLRRDVSMTGEITLRGNILPIGGLNEKLVAAQRAGFRAVILPAENEKDLAEIPKEAKEGLTIVLVDTIDQALPYVFADPGKKGIPALAGKSARGAPPARPYAQH
ncbi:MAG: endopeptidase La [Candidatus Eisenbacteria bacterium]|nr:endopeptidase La [Candidatus Eisenbacteria bacterium]